MNTIFFNLNNEPVLFTSIENGLPSSPPLVLHFKDGKTLSCTDLDNPKGKMVIEILKNIGSLKDRNLNLPNITLETFQLFCELINGIYIIDKRDLSSVEQFENLRKFLNLFFKASLKTEGVSLEDCVFFNNLRASLKDQMAPFLTVQQANHIWETFKSSNRKATLLDRMAKQIVNAKYYFQDSEDYKAYFEARKIVQCEVFYLQNGINLLESKILNYRNNPNKDDLETLKEIDVYRKKIQLKRLLDKALKREPRLTLDHHRNMAKETENSDAEVAKLAMNSLQVLEYYINGNRQ